MLKTRVLFLGLILLVLSVFTFADSKMGTINKGKSKVWSFYSDYSNKIMATVMWNKTGTDLDLAFFIMDSNDDPMIISAGLSQTKIFEQIACGVLKSVKIYVMILSSSGPGCRYTLNVQIAKSESIYTQSRLIFLGEFGEEDQSSIAVVAKKAVNELNRIRESL